MRVFGVQPQQFFQLPNIGGRVELVDDIRMAMRRCYPDTAAAIGCAVALTAPQAFDGFNGIIFRFKMLRKGFVKGVAFG